ncbi:MAG: CRISPR-associated endonuclease Cas2 [Thermoplasmatales archaeon]|nr:CRISPR-associated endonuclease Cas2 [Thermoplasmatales archaeon]
MVVGLYVIIVYDIMEKRVSKVCNFLRIYLNWIQNSVFEGEITEGKLEEIRIGLKNIIDKNEDSILIFTVSNKKWLNKEILGIEKAPISTII